MKEVFPWLTLGLPLGAALAITLFTHRNKELSARLAIGAVVAAFWLAVLPWFDPASTREAFELRWTWLAVDELRVDFGLRVDRLSLLMLLVVTAVGGAIQIYSYEYLRGDRGFSRYFACMSLFTFAMLGLVFSTNFVQLFIFWELVGVSSYLLIGHWYERPAAADAGLKAFLCNRVGDAGFLLGILLIWGRLGTVHFGELAAKLSAHPEALGGVATLAGLLIFCGAVGKSAQFPLHVWLPDAMEGPTPVSALIHAATMVAAGVYMLCRVFFLFGAVPVGPVTPGWLTGVSALDVITWVGALTALLAAGIAVQQNDLKRILAYSTLSQLGYMVMAVGLSGPAPAMFHLTTHAFFKALLFLGAGVIIHALHHQQDIWVMGGLRRKMPLTFGLFVGAALALCGLPPFSGFFSKDAILWQAYQHSPLAFLVAVAVAVLTAFYMTRLILVVFFGPERSAAVARAREAPSLMLQPMLFLGVPTLLLGFWGVEGYLSQTFGTEPGAAAHAWWEQLFAPFAHAPLAAFAGLGAFAFGAYAAWEFYREAARDPLVPRLGGWSRALRHGWYIDRVYERTLLAWQEGLARLADGVDRWILAEWVVGGAQGTTEFVGRVLRLVQTGNLHAYVWWFAVGVVVLVTWVLLH